MIWSIQTFSNAQNVPACEWIRGVGSLRVCGLTAHFVKTECTLCAGSASRHPGIWASKHLGIWAAEHLGIRAPGHPSTWASGHPSTRTSEHRAIWASEHVSLSQHRAALDCFLSNSYLTYLLPQHTTDNNME